MKKLTNGDGTAVIFRDDFAAQCSIRSVIALPVPDILSVCKAEEGDDAVDTPADDNAVDGKIGGTESVVTDRMEYWGRK